MEKERKDCLWIVISVACSTFMISMDLTIVSISLPSISRYFHVSAGEVSRVMIYFLLFFTATMLIFGKMADRVGLKKILLWGYVIFSLSSLLCGFSNNMGMLIFFRCVEGIGAAMYITCAFAVIPRFLPSGIIGWAFGIQIIGTTLGNTISAPLGGIINKFLAWPVIFFVNVFFGIAAFFIAERFIPSDEPAHREMHRGFDIPGTLLSFVSLFAFLYALNSGQKYGWTSPFILYCFGLSCVLFYFFIQWQKRAPSPLLDLSLFGNTHFNLALVTSVMAFAVNSGIRFLIPFYLEMGLGLSPEKMGMIFLLFPLANLVVGPLAGRASDTINPHVIVASSLGAIAVACGLFACTLTIAGLWPVIIFLVFLGVAYGLFYPPNNHLIMGLSPPGKHGVASTTCNTIRNLSMAIGVSIFEIFFTRGLPAGGSSHAGAGLSLPQMAGGFQNAFAIGGWMCIAGLAATLIIIRGESRRKD